MAFSMGWEILWPLILGFAHIRSDGHGVNEFVVLLL